MSTPSAGAPSVDLPAPVGAAAGYLRAKLSVPRILAVVGVALTVGAFLSVLHGILRITGQPRQLYYVVAAAAVVGAGLSRVIRPRTAGLLGGASILVGTYLYIQSLPGGFGFLALLAPMLDDAVALLSGLSVLRIVNADVWALTAAPAPVFLATYLAFRRRYVSAAAVAGAALGLLVLTGDATVTVTLVGVLGVTLAVAFGDCDRRGESVRNADAVVVLLAAMVVLTLFVGVVPGAAGSLVSTDGVGSETATMESSLVHAGDSLAVTGPVELSPEVRYTVEADEEAYWRVGTYDRYTGGGWVRTGELRSYDGGARLSGPPGDSRSVSQEFTAETSIATLPAARQPTSIDDVPVPVQVTEGGSFQPASPLQAGERYRTESEVPTASPSQLRAAGTDYPDAIEERYTQLPTSTPDRVVERTDRLTANAENPYDTARVLEQWFHNNYDYSTDVQRPRGDITDEFLFNMDAGYCTYFATSMVTMLRSQGIPARFAVGYTSGQQVADDEWVVRGYNSHAWVEVYFPGHGWMEFDPTPQGPRRTSEAQTLQEARDEGSTSVDTNDSLDPGVGGEDPTDASALGENGSGETPAVDPGSGPGADGDGGPSIPVPTREQAGFGLLLLAGLAAAVRRTGTDRRLYRAVWLRRLPEGGPEAVVTAVYHRVLHLEERERRPKAPGETPRQFFAHAGDGVRRVGQLYERARYGHGVDAADAREAVDILAGLLEERSRLPAFLTRERP